MENDLRVRAVIQQIVRQEMNEIASETKDVVRDAVRDILYPQLRTAIRDSISEAMWEVLIGEMTPPQSKEITQPTPAFSPKNMLSGVEEEHAVGEIEVNGEGVGSYVYCIVDSKAAASLGEIGIEGSEVYTIPYKSVCAVVHDCPVEPYASDDEEVVKGWVQTHQRVLDTAMERFGTVLPLGFDTIVKSVNGADPKQVVMDWLKDDYENLRKKMGRVKGKQEFAVQVFYDPKIMGVLIARESEEIQKLKEEMASQKPGMAYMFKQRMEIAVKEEMERRVGEYFRDFYQAVKEHVEDIKGEKVKRNKGKTMLMNLSCLISKNEVEALGDVLERIDNMDGFSVRFTGPWAPYSFV